VIRVRAGLRVRPAWLGWLAVGIMLGAGCGHDGGDAATLATLSEEELPEEVIAAEGVVLRLQAELVAVMREATELGYVGRYQRLEAVARESFDIPMMARMSYGPGWAQLSPEQQQVWLETFERFHISSIADIRSRYSGQVYRLLGFERPAADTVRIRSVLDYPGRAVDIFVDYTVSERSQGWRIVDIHRPPAVSEVAMRRAEYRTLLERGGFDGLVAEMNARVEARR
jgi:phospholipid transport system substrate-binding protein